MPPKVASGFLLDVGGRGWGQPCEGGMVHEVMVAENSEHSVFINADSPRAKGCRQSNANNGLSATSAGQVPKLA